MACVIQLGTCFALRQIISDILKDPGQLDAFAALGRGDDLSDGLGCRRPSDTTPGRDQVNGQYGRTDVAQQPNCSTVWEWEQHRGAPAEGNSGVAAMAVGDNKAPRPHCCDSEAASAHSANARDNGALNGKGGAIGGTLANTGVVQCDMVCGSALLPAALCRKLQQDVMRCVLYDSWYSPLSDLARQAAGAQQPRQQRLK
jgi:hypothetical protein